MALRVKGRKFFVFSVDKTRVVDALKHLSANIGKEVASELKSRNTGPNIVEHMKSRLDSILESPGTRAGIIKKTLPKGLEVKQLDASKSQKIIGNMIKSRSSTGTPLFGKIAKPRSVLLGVGHIPTLDTETKISKLDSMDRPRHKAPFNDPPNPEKKINSPSSHIYSLWSILENRQKFSYKIPRYTSGPVTYTTEQDGYRHWHRSRSVTWRAQPITAFQAYYLLNLNRQVYKDDRDLFYKDVVGAVKKFVETKSRFRKL
jgi:hypothetical protein